MTDPGDRDTIELYIRIIHRTERAILVDDGDGEVWLPLSQVEIIEEDRNGDASIIIPMWLAKDKELI